MSTIIRFTIFVVLLSLMIAGLSIDGRAEGLNKEMTLDSLIEEALSNNPMLLSAKKRYEAQKARIPQETALEDPWIGIEFEQTPKGTLSFGDAPMRMYSVSQEVPFPTKIFTRTKAQIESTRAAYHRYKEKERMLISEVKSLYSKIYLLYKAIDINGENKALLEQLAKTAATRFSIGKTSQQDVLKAQVEIAHIDNELVMLEQQRQVAVARLNILLNRYPEEELGRPKINERLREIGPVNHYYELAREKRPELLAFGNEVKRQKAMYSLALQDYLPDFMLEAEQRDMNTDMDSGWDGWDAMVKVKVPLWFMQKQNFGVKEAKRELEMMKAELKNTENMVLLEVKEAYSMLEADVKLALLYETSFMPQAEQTLKASLTGYESDQVDFLNLLDSQRMLLEFKLDYYKILADLETAKADLERAVGMDLF